MLATRPSTATHFHPDTPDELRRVLDSLRLNGTRVRIHYGYTKENPGIADGESWLEENDTTGTIGRSTGERPILLILANSRSSGGPGILDHCIVHIADSRTGRTIYRHPKFRLPPHALVPNKGEHAQTHPYAVAVGGGIHATFRTELARARFVRKMFSAK